MRITKKKDINLPDIDVLVSYPSENSEVERLLTVLHSFDKQLLCNVGHREQMVNVSDIYYIESVDKKTFVYLENEVMKTESRLYQLRENLAASGFVQISKSCLLNLNVLESIQPLLNSRMEALLTNGEKLLVTRKYLGEIKSALQGGAK